MIIVADFAAPQEGRKRFAKADGDATAIQVASNAARVGFWLISVVTNLS